MLEENDENDAAKMLNSDCKIYVQESEKLQELEKLRNSQMYIEFDDLCYSVNRNRKEPEKKILHNLTGYFEPGKVTVIIGPSGAGKTTLLKIVSAKRLIDVKGTIIINGVEQNKGTFRKQVCYVPQQFDLLPFLTTRETLYIAARLKLNVNQNEHAIHSVVNDIVKGLGLSYCLNTFANKLSGGERKRLSIGVEMITKPSVLLLDEPTSGLDSVASNQLINMLHNMARANCTVVCVIHQPSSQMISLFDNIMVLNRGRCMYCGPKSEILNTYSIAGFTCPSFYNIAEFVLEVITEQRGGDLENLYKICRDECEKIRHSKHNENELDSLTDSKQKYRTHDINTSINKITSKKSTWQQQRILFLRALICMRRDIMLTQLRLATHVLVGLILGTVFYNFGNNAEYVGSNIACLFFFLLFLFFASAMPAVQMFPTEAAVFLQEHLNNWYSLKAYYSVKVLTDLPIQILCVSPFLLISYYITGQPMEYDRFLQTWSVCLLITIIGQTFGILTGTAFGTELGIFLIPATSIPLLLFSGFFLKLNEMSIYLQPLSFVSFFRYAFEGIMQAVYLNRTNLVCPEIYCYLRSPNKILSMMGMPAMSFHVILIILCCWILFLHVTIYTVFRWKIYHAKK
ncbi:PREDICTED: ATP-binding cassette sub-family G member 4-like [Trachymyrmex septentrionalis]|uniref:ATP-binding cassette sub-family G member 4-like n=1 Tax=Trachymyrmex septentrionalis TaxID=34720 RepID=UPI00084F59F3|nr:PREDICTED: ATP-binding cassette sub-family G member 4-like [Trachymyrmex septentrionalis]XP_018338582.1 PREDICTED: ATP-binding cassette sub-family G member 4-like [Trachymyrmex septentrionalis]XP_018338583.1 PREDICTED: ATP-binding cassette sub-family G member 4-like [Trachymyrmex septentrionalis]XP_018338584.1 PREDICTED: ATP-binding cassette sub-family G member 4-like [Trachymyrmex septentrionalis]